MCQYTLLHHCEHGYVIKCNKCDHFQIAFGTTAISLNEEQFMQFREVIIERLQESNEDFPQQKSIHIPTIYPSICLVYSQKELKQLHALLESSHFSMEVKKLLVQHSIQSN